MRRIIWGCFVLVMSGVFVITSMGAPIMPSSKLKDQVRSLDRIKKLRVRLEPLSPDITALKVDVGELVAIQRRKLREAGFEIVSDAQSTKSGPAVPRLTMEINGVGDDRVADAIACTISLTIEQEARIERLNETLFLPTFTRHATALVLEAEVRQTLRQTMIYLVDQFVDWSRMATTER